MKLLYKKNDYIIMIKKDIYIEYYFFWFEKYCCIFYVYDFFVKNM